MCICVIDIFRFHDKKSKKKMFFTIRRKRLNINLFDELYDRLIEMKYPAYENDRLILEMVDIY